MRDGLAPGWPRAISNRFPGFRSRSCSGTTRLLPVPELLPRQRSRPGFPCLTCNLLLLDQDTLMLQTCLHRQFQVPVPSLLDRLGGVLLWLADSTLWCSLVSAQTASQTAQAPKQDVATAKTATSRALGFEVAYPSVLGTEPISARVYVMLGRGNSQLEPRFGPDWFRPQPFFARDVKGWKPTQTVRIDSAATGFPGPLDSLEAGDYAIQAVVRVNPDTHRHRHGRGQRLWTGRPRQDRSQGTEHDPPRS